MSRTRRPRPVKPSTNHKTAGASLFDPAVFLATAAVGRDISKFSKREVIFAQGDDADAVFYIKKGKVKVAVISDALGDRVGNVGMRDDASGKDRNSASHS